MKYSKICICTSERVAVFGIKRMRGKPAIPRRSRSIRSSIITYWSQSLGHSNANNVTYFSSLYNVFSSRIYLISSLHMLTYTKFSQPTNFSRFDFSAPKLSSIRILNDTFTGHSELSARTKYIDALISCLCGIGSVTVRKGSKATEIF